MDKIDLRILSALQADGRKKNAELAREIGVAPSTMLERVKRLEERRVLTGFRAVIDPESLGLTVQSLVTVTLDRHNADHIRDLEQNIQNVPHVRACYHVTGRFDYVLHVAARDLNHLGRLIKERIASIPGVGRVETFIVLSEIKSDQGWPIEVIEPEEESDG